LINENIFNPQKPNIPIAWKIGTVITPGEHKATVLFAGESSATSKYYQSLKSYTPVSGDHVILAWFSGTGIILGNY
jgi:hypothetical protein